MGGRNVRQESDAPCARVQNGGGANARTRSER